MNKKIVIDLKSLYTTTAKIKELPDYIEIVLKEAGEGNIITLTGQAPIWLYLKISHALHGKAKKLYYSSPATGDILIFDHNAF